VSSSVPGNGEAGSKPAAETEVSKEAAARLAATHCRPVLSRRLHWNWTRAGEVAIQVTMPKTHF
jgi:hypothetical protein